MLAGIPVLPDIGRLKAAARGSLVASLLTSALGLVMVVFGGPTVFLSRGLVGGADIFGFCLSVVPDLLFRSEPVVDPDLLDLLSSRTLVRPANVPEPVLLPVAAAGVVVVLLVGADLVVGAVFAAGADRDAGAELPAGPDLAAGASLGAVLAVDLVAWPGLGVGLICFPTTSFAPGFGFAPVEDFLGDTATALELDPLVPVVFFSGTSFTSALALFSWGAGDISFTGVAGVIFTLGMLRLAPTLSPVSTEVSCSGENSASSSSPVSLGVFNMNPTSSLASKDMLSASPLT